MAINLLLLLIGLAVLWGGGDILVRGASALARSFGVPPLVIGLTIVAFGTSAPELSVNLIAAVKGNAEISFGNIIGSNIANIGLIIGICAIIRPLAIEGAIITREIPMMVLASVLALVMGMDGLLRDSPNTFDRSEGIVLLLIFCVFLFYTIGDVIKKRRADPLIQQVEKSPRKKGFNGTAFNLLLVAGGLVLLVCGARLTVDAAVVIAGLLKMPDAIIGLTVVAVGTSLPELAASGVAAWKGQPDIAIGNVVGSSIFNILLVAGLCASLRPIPVPAAGGMLDLSMMLFLSLFLLPLSFTDKSRIVRWEGALLVSLYIAFSLWRLNA